ncbi:MAG TPA: FtsX-like permease family protein [Dehalococcoidia bacterium]|nr:FtsX-like permease family protein [Dehalococcoidia bacterium]
MEAVFGVPMNAIMLALLGLLGVTVASIVYVVIRSRVMFLIGLRNIPRRPAQTVLILLGLMLSTLIISAALTTGDTVDYSITNRSYNLLGHVDEVIRQAGGGDDPLELSHSTIPQEKSDRVGAAVKAAADPNIDGYLPALLEPAPVLNPRTKQREPSVNFVGVDAASMRGFPDIVSLKTGRPLEIGALAEDQVYLNQSAANELEAAPGDKVQVTVKGQVHEFTVADVVEDRELTGAVDFRATKGMVQRLDVLQGIFKRAGEVNFVAVSNAGGIRDGLALTAPVVARLEGILTSEGLAAPQPGDPESGPRESPNSAPAGNEGLTLEAHDIKRERVDQAEEAGNFLATFFLLMGLFSIAAGMLLILMIFVMLAVERKSEMGMARAVGTKRGHLVQMFMSEGLAYDLASALVGAGLGIIVAFLMAETMARIFPVFNLSIQTHVTARSLVTAYALGVVLTFATVTFSAWRVSKLNIALAIRDLAEPSGGGMGRRWLAAGVLGLALGSLLVVLGTSHNSAFPFALGFSLVTAGAAIMLRFVGMRERPVFTIMGVALLLLWGLTAGNRLKSVFGELNGDIEMFFLSGVAMVTAATLILIHNADLALAAVSRLGGFLGTALPATKTAVAYPLANKFRTGMTLAMISLVVFALTMMSAMNLNFDKLFLADTARGGWDVVVDESPNNPISNLPEALRGAGSPAPDGFRAVGRVSVAARSSASEVTDGPLDYKDYPVKAPDGGFIDGGLVPLKARARGYTGDRSVWEELKARDDVAVVDGFTVSTGGFRFGDQFAISGIAEGASEFDPVFIEVRNPGSGETARVKVIGVIDFGASANFVGVYVSPGTFATVFGEPGLSTHYVGLVHAGGSKAAAQEIEAALFDSGVQAESLKARAEDDRALSRGFFLLMQAFMGLGLFVGIAAVGVISFRTVVERRQQIGMLRAIGYQRSTVALSFLLESSFVTLLGTLSGVALAMWLSYFLVTSDDFPSELGGYYIPWPQIAVISGFTIGASLLMTLIPSRQAASVPIAEALRYE